MAGEGTFPKSDGDILYASEVNVFDSICGTAIHSDTTGYTTTNQAETIVRTLTFTGISAKTLVFIYCKCGGTDHGFFSMKSHANKYIAVQGRKVASHDYQNYYETTGNGGSFVVPVVVEVNDEIELMIESAAGGATGIIDIQVFSGAQGISVGGS